MTLNLKTAVTNNSRSLTIFSKSSLTSKLKACQVIAFIQMSLLTITVNNIFGGH